ncbi:MAG: hypothetical protein KUG82_20775 [Pseudomonadales bacterium]|nr:hypothetical protein [Pseudomonadales bacterium]
MNIDLLRIVLLSSVVVIAACGGGGGGDGESSGDGGGTSNTDDGGNDGGGGSTNTGSSSTATMTFNISSAVALLANSDVVEAVASSSMVRGVAGEKPLFTYRIVNNSARSIRAVDGEDDGTATDSSTDAETTTESSSEDSESEGGSTNLLSIDEDGNASLAIESNVPIKILYTLASPDGDSVYVALDNGWYDYDGNDYTQYIAANNCALYKVTIVDNAFDCVEEGLYVQNMDDSYRKAISGNQKPIQFDSAGNLYFAATTFSVGGDSWCMQYDENGDCIEEETNYWIEGSDWQPRIYMRDVDTGEVSAVTQDNESIDFFLVLPSGELVFQSYNETNWQNELSILQGSQKIDLSGGSWGVDFFTVDSGNTVIFGQGDYSGTDENGLRFARPRTEGGVEKASLNTSLFGADNRNSGWGNPKPRRIIPGDDGRLYGVFEGGRDTYDSSGNYDGWTQILTLYQMLPYDGVPKLELELGTNVDWWSWMGDTPFQISRGYLYYTETIDVEFLGTADVIRMMNLTTRETTTLLEPVAGGDPRYQIYNWRLNGTIIYFSGLNKNGNVVVTGELDTVVIREGEDITAALTVNATASALGATSSVQDIEVLLPQQPEVDTGSSAVVLEVHQDMDNLYSMSVDFSKYMDKDLVAEHLALTSGDTSEGPMEDGGITYLPVWLFKTLHLIPDLDGLGASDTVAMSPGTEYTLSFASGIRDAYDWDLTATDDSLVTLRPDNGWYVGTLSDSVDATVAETDVLRYAGPDTLGDLETFNLGSIPADVRFEFSGKNMGWEGPQLMIWDDDSGVTDTWTKTIVRLRMGNWSDLEYRDTDGNGMWDNAETPEMFNGTFKRYRVDLYGANLMVSVSEDGSTYSEVEGLTQANMGARASTYSLLLRARDSLQLDNLEISTLDSSGGMMTVAGDIYSEDFNGDTEVPSSFATDVTATLNLENW